jgi:CheY-like chemotaxis protein
MSDQSPIGLFSSLNGKRVLVAEDEALLAMLIEQTLANAGAIVLGPAATVAEALSLIEQAKATENGISGAVVDLNLGGDNASPICDALDGLGVPYLFATGYSDTRQPPDRAQVPVLQKPYSPEDLLATLAMLLSSGG